MTNSEPAQEKFSVQYLKTIWGSVGRVLIVHAFGQKKRGFTQNYMFVTNFFSFILLFVKPKMQI